MRLLLVLPAQAELGGDRAVRFTIFSSDRLAEKTISAEGEQVDLWYSGKAREHGGNTQALLAPNGFPLWASDVRLDLYLKSSQMGSETEVYRKTN